ncbi:MAG: hypothetical protein Q8S52_05675, partial [Methylobacter sp.]|nr:hypothetical protein [Methylobacter sp.]MDP2426506.1 hypothetical protein [Methylobacter sp.]MDP3361598.1 hypothetical protein [Methylobacter sp.]
ISLLSRADPIVPVHPVIWPINEISVSQKICSTSKSKEAEKRLLSMWRSGVELCKLETTGQK